jgi:hypothetical protein
MSPPLIYFDTSTLADAFDAVYGPRTAASEPYLRLHDLIEKAARRGTVVSHLLTCWSSIVGLLSLVFWNCSRRAATAAEFQYRCPDKPMPRFRVMLKGAPVFLLDVESQKIDRLGFYTTRWVQAASADEAGRVVRQLVLEELARSGTKNPPELPIHVAVEEIGPVSWFEAVRRGPGQGFRFYPDVVS